MVNFSVDGLTCVKNYIEFETNFVSGVGGNKVLV